MENSKIEWTHHTFNPYEGCTKVSPGCQHCYASSMAKRFESVRGVIWGPHGTRVRTSEANWKKVRTWNRKATAAGERHRVFCASMADVFEEGWAKVLDPIRRDLFALIEETQNLDWLLLTKRPHAIAPTLKRLGLPKNHFERLGNVWLGTSTENDEWARRRIPHLIKVPAAVHFISAEPLLGPIQSASLSGIEWVIVGGESGGGARPMATDWARGLRERCVAGGISFFFKQWGGRSPKAAGRILDGRTWDEIPAPVVGGVS